MNDFYQNFMFNNARDLEVSLFNNYFLNEGVENCLLALSLYINEDGGISNIDPDNLNNVSTLPSAIYFFNVLNELKYNNEEEYFNETIIEVINYLKKQKEFTYFHKSNKNKACHMKFKTNEYLFELEAITYCYIAYYSKDDSYMPKINELIEKYLNTTNPTFNQIFYFKKIEHMFNNEVLKNKIISDVKNNLDNVYGLIYSNDDYLLHNYKNELILLKDNLKTNKNNLGVWERDSSWGNGYPEEEVCNLKYLGITAITNLLFIKRVEEYEKNNK